MGNAILASEIFGAIFLAIIIYGELFENKRKNPIRSSSILLIISVIFTLLIDAFTYLPFNWADYEGVYFLLIVGTFVCPYIVSTLFMNYFYKYLQFKIKLTRTNITTWMILVSMLLCILGIVLSFIYGFTGKLFTIENGIYNVGSKYENYQIYNVIVISICLLVIIFNAKKIGRHDTIASLIFMLLPQITILINIFYPSYAFGVSAMSISTFIINTMLKASDDEKLVSRTTPELNPDYYDLMTGAFNRRAYVRQCENIFGKEDCVGVVIAEVNLLDSIYSHCGVNAGDKKVKDTVTLLNALFRKEDIFRISTNTFIVLAVGIPQSVFDSKVKTLKHRVDFGDYPIASVGHSYGLQDNLAKHLDNAEVDLESEKILFGEKYSDLYKN